VILAGWVHTSNYNFLAYFLSDTSRLGAYLKLQFSSLFSLQNILDAENLQVNKNFL